ncbi:hypothetical protein [Hymenobacter psychrotolerans]|uniref:DUF4348 domain-containing protein n=1 Tax=Hymenobacter psychrotolerans DSM 18569 TaxID=1121959 RepID=A0A1M6Y635_9BACT|nr:hypothetical protein [Hymenobacter psychrotolerans]SHL13734.1 hypothetical protein SAMN02746009_02201 [Hymenobacter psychrotolerans DSM 18569]
MTGTIRLLLTAFLLLSSSIAYCQGVSEPFILQQLLDLPELQQYFHIDLPGRLPLKLLRNSDESQGLQLEKFGRPVLLLTPAQAKQQAVKDYVNIRKIPAHATADTLTYTLAYPIEGALCRARFVRKKAGWIMYDYSLVEQ